MLVSIYNWI